MGDPGKGRIVKALQKNASGAPAPQGAKKKRKKARAEEIFNVARIREERTIGRSTEYLVEWEGYEVEWEEWRIDGQPGDPVATWEAWSPMLASTEAMEAWEA